MVRRTCGRMAWVAVILMGAMEVAAAKGPDQSLLRLVAPGARLVAGMKAPTTAGQPDSFLLLTHNNHVDLADFFALTGVDEARVIHQVVYVAGEAGEGGQGVHCLLVSGHFDEALIMKRALANGATEHEWKGVRVVAVPRFARERGASDETRWLAVLRSTIVVFGSEASVREALDRDQSRAAADAELMRRLNHLRTEDDAWCVVTAVPGGDEIWRSLQSFDPQLGALLHEDDGLAFGIHYGSRVEFEYEVTAAGGGSAKSISDMLARSLEGTREPQSTFTPTGAGPDEGRTARGVVKVSKNRYDAWLAEVLARVHGHGSI